MDETLFKQLKQSLLEATEHAKSLILDDIQELGQEELMIRIELYIL